MTPAEISRWVEALLARHTAGLTRPELLKAIRALSARYVERRTELSRRSPLDSAGKRAAFAAFYAPLHYLTVGAVRDALGRPPLPGRLCDLGCGTGVTAAAWAADARGITVDAVDRDGWAVAEARWNFRYLGIRHRVRQGDLVRTARRLADRVRLRNGRSGSGFGVVAGWSVNELRDDDRADLLDAMLALVTGGASVLVVEPLAGSAAPWWDAWSAAFVERGGRADEWHFDVGLPAPLEPLDLEAGFRRRGLSARSLFHPPVR